MRHRHWLFVMALGSTLLPITAAAQNGHEATTQGETAQMKEARERYMRGLKLFADKDYEAARIEFMKAYELAPSNKILYNIGVCDANRNDYVSAIQTLERYLKEGGSDVPAERRTEVENLLKDIRPRVGHLSIHSNVAGAVVSVDDKVVGNTPMGGTVDVNPGTRKVSAAKDGYFPATQAITVAGSETQNVELRLEPTVTVKVAASPWPFVLWGTTAALGVGAVVTGIFAIKASNDLNTLDNTCGNCPPNNATPSATASDLQSKRNEMRTLSIVADSLTGGAVAVGIVALVVTLTTGKKHTEAAPTTSALNVGVTPGGLSFSGVF